MCIDSLVSAITSKAPIQWSRLQSTHAVEPPNIRYTGTMLHKEIQVIETSVLESFTYLQCPLYPYTVLAVGLYAGVKLDNASCEVLEAVLSGVTTNCLDFEDAVIPLYFVFIYTPMGEGERDGKRGINITCLHVQR